MFFRIWCNPNCMLCFGLYFNPDGKIFSNFRPGDKIEVHRIEEADEDMVPME